MRKRPTWVRWDLLPAVLRLRGERRAADELFDLGYLSTDAYRIVSTLEDAGGTLTTRELRAAAGFPTGKDQRAAYGKAMDELDSRLMVSKAFSPANDEMKHQLVSLVHSDYVRQADELSEEEAWTTFLEAYLHGAAFAFPPVLARHLGVDPAAALGRLRDDGKVREARVDGYKGLCFVWESEQP